MKNLLGIDLGTSSVKAILINEDGKVIALEQAFYDIKIPFAGFAEQSTDNWWKATKQILLKITSKYKNEADQISGISFSGQMHGLVCLDSQGTPVCDVIIWLDQRSEKQVKTIYKKIGKERMRKTILNPLSTGFALPSLMWIKENQPDVFKNIHQIILPKDYIRYLMTGQIITDYSDASGTVAFNTERREWAYEILQELGLASDIFPYVCNSKKLAGEITKEAAQETGLKVKTPVFVGGGDQPVQCIGNGLVSSGKFISNIGTAGQVSAFSAEPVFDKKFRTHTFCHVVDKAWSVFGATMASGLSLTWLYEKILKEADYRILDSLAGAVAPGSDGMLYLPYLAGERTPHLDPRAKGMFFGLTLKHERKHFIRSVLEGVSFSLKDSLEIIKAMNLKANKIIASGGGAKSEVWLQIQADIFNLPVYTNIVQEEACLGAAMIAGVGASLYESYEDAVNRLVRFNKKVFEPIQENVIAYKQRYEVYKKLYIRNKELF